MTPSAEDDSPLIDGGVFAGSAPHLRLSVTIDAIVRQFDRFGVAAGLVCNYRSLFCNMDAGNDEALEWADRYPGRVHALAYLGTRRYGIDAGRYAARLGREGFSAALLVGTDHPAGDDLASPASRRWSSAVRSQGIVVQVLIGSDRDLSDMVGSWPVMEAPVLVRRIGGARYRDLANEIAALAERPDLHFDVSSVTSVAALELLINTVGEERLFLASNSPESSAACAYQTFLSTRLPRGRSAVAGGNLRSIMGLGNQPEPASDSDPFPPPEGRAGFERLREHRKIDVHWHPDSWNLAEPGLADDEQSSTWDDFSISRVVGSSVEALTYDMRAGNARTEETADRLSRLFGMIVVDPTDIDASEKEIARLASHPRFLGIKTIQDHFGIGIDDPAYLPILHAARRLSFPVMCHLTGLAGAATQYRDVTFIGTHATPDRLQTLADCPNVLFDFATSSASPGDCDIRRLIDTVGAHRILFGSDGPLISPAWSLAKLYEAQPTTDELKSILWDNAVRVFPRLNVPTAS